MKPTCTDNLYLYVYNHKTTKLLPAAPALSQIMLLCVLESPERGLHQFPDLPLSQELKYHWEDENVD